MSDKKNGLSYTLNRTHCLDFPPVDSTKQVIKDLVAVRETHLTCAQSRRVGVSPSSFNTFAAGPRSSDCVVKIETALAIFAMCFEVKFWYDERDS
jgi:hypothetical protein